MRFKNKSLLTNLNILRFIKERNKLLVSFLCGVSGLEFSVKSQQIQYAFASTLEMCYYLRNLNLVLLHCFLGNLVQSQIFGSKSVSVVNGKTQPGGGYQTLRSSLELHRTEPLPCDKGTIDIFFDNTGKYVIKNYCISTEKIKTANIITTCIQIAVDHKTHTSVQKNNNFKPKNTTTRNIKAIHSEMENEINKANDLLRIYRYNFLKKLLHIAVNEEDQIDNKIKEIGASTKRLCSNEKCSKLFYCLKRKCDCCGGVVNKYYEEVGSLIFCLSNVFNEIEISENKVLEKRPMIKMSANFIKS